MSTIDSGIDNGPTNFTATDFEKSMRGVSLDSWNGSREGGSEALDVYSDLKTIYINADSRRAIRG